MSLTIRPRHFLKTILVVPLGAVEDLPLEVEAFLSAFVPPENRGERPVLKDDLDSPLLGHLIPLDYRSAADGEIADGGKGEGVGMKAPHRAVCWEGEDHRVARVLSLSKILRRFTRKSASRSALSWVLTKRMVRMNPSRRQSLTKG